MILKSFDSSTASKPSKIDTSIKIASEDNEIWEKTNINGEEVFEANKHSTFNDVRKKANEEGKNANFRYNFNDPDLVKQLFQNSESLQMVDLHITSRGEYMNFPIEYTYICPECGHEMTMKEYEVASTNGRIKCQAMVEATGSDGSLKHKRCNNPLSPAGSRETVKDSYVYNVQLKDSYGQELNSSAMSFRRIPPGQCTAVIYKVPREYNPNFIFILDYEKIKKDSFEMPEREAGVHYMRTLVNKFSQYLEDKTGYKHFGFLPMQFAMLAKFATSNNDFFRNDFHMNITGDRSTGKSTFIKLWGVGLYGEDFFQTSAASISTPKLRGTMESIYLMGKEYRYQFTGFLGLFKEILIDEINDNADLKKDLKQYGLETNFDFSKQGGSNIQIRRTAQWSVTQNINVLYKRQFEKDVVKIYNEVQPKGDDKLAKWDYSIDLELPLESYSDPYVRYAIKKTRNNYERNQIFWPDGSSLPEAQRNFFFFMLSRQKTSEELTNVIKANNTKRIISESYELQRTLCNKNMKEFCQETINQYLESGNELEYFNKVDGIMDLYDMAPDPRFKQMCYTLIKVIKVFDQRKDYNETDLEIFQYILENMYTKIEVADTNDFVIKGRTKESREEDEEIERAQKDATGDGLGYQDALDSMFDS